MESFGTEFGFCAQTASVWQFVGLCLMVFKIVIPVILIVISIINLGKAVVSSDDKDVKKAVTGMIKKFVVAVIIFFIPNLVTALFSIASNFDDVKEDYLICKECIARPNGEKCERKVASLE